MTIQTQIQTNIPNKHSKKVTKDDQHCNTDRTTLIHDETDKIANINAFKFHKPRNPVPNYYEPESEITILDAI